MVTATGAKNFHATDLDTIENVIGLSPRDPLNGFGGRDMLYTTYKN